MYHLRFKGTHYGIGYQWGNRLNERGKFLLDNVAFPITAERIEFAKKVRPHYERWYPEVLEEIRGIAEGQQADPALFEAVLLSMYCIMPENKCSCFVSRDKGQVILARNSDFLTELEKLYMNCSYQPHGGAYSFQGNTTAFVEMEDGINEHGLAIGLTSVYPKVMGDGLNAGLLLRFGLEKCKTVAEFIEALKEIPIASSQTFTTADRSGAAAVIECNSEKMEIDYLDEKHIFAAAVNSFHLPSMGKYRVEGIDDWNAEERYATIERAFSEQRNSQAVPFAMDVLGGKYGFICQYDRSSGKDTVWSAVYDVTAGKIYRCEGNPSRKRFVEDGRFALS